MAVLEYEPQVLHRLWDVEKEIYQEFARVCDKHGLTYFCAYGTALGAIRHQGFIPWDDDIDVSMPREDYEAFLSLAPGELGGQYELLDVENTKGYVMTFAKLTRRDTTFVEATDQDRTYHSGIFIDIFPIDVIYEDAAKRDRLGKKCWFLARLCVLSEYKHPKLPAALGGAKKSLARLACAGAYYALKAVGLNTKKLYAKYLKETTRPLREQVCGLYADVTQYGQECNYGQEDVTFREEDLFPTVMVPFEDIYVPVPHNCHQYLTNLFGDYMTLPPLEQRHTHYPAVLDFGT